MGITEGTFEISAYAEQLIVVLAVFPVTLVLGRVFCGFLCSFGAMGDLIWRVSSKLIPSKWRKKFAVSEKLT